MIPAGYWQAAKTSEEYTLASCCVSPGFDFSDFEMLRNLNASLRPNTALKEPI